jgi:hypothetical protein
MDAITFELMKCAICHYFNQYPVQDSNIKITEDKDKKKVWYWQKLYGYISITSTDIHMAHFINSKVMASIVPVTPPPV